LLRVAVNVSPIQLRRKDFLDSMIDGIERAGDDPSALELEITEGVVMRDIEDSIRKLSVLRGMGIHISIDDFGTGYSSLSYMTRLPIDTLKIDRSFVIGLAESGDSATVASGIIALAHSLKLGVIAEGVETREQAERLLTMGCDEVQGYLYSKPVPVEAFEALLRAQQLPSGK
jgi:EAL domain-containing protein (putative c-di-GMP-specific phosphodiesterase class I)